MKKSSQYAAAWMVHILTAAGAVIGLLALYALHRGILLYAFWLIGVTILIDSVDGMLARKFRVNIFAPRLDGALLDNIVDYFNYAVVPAFFIMVTDILPEHFRVLIASLIVLSSAYQFSQVDAKTEDHFFKGFPSYWNLAVFYLFVWRTEPWVNAIILSLLIILVFVPVKYVYPSRMRYLSRRRFLRLGMLVATVLFGAASVALLWFFPDSHPLLVYYTGGYFVLYAVASVYRTLVPLSDTRSETEEHFCCEKGSEPNLQ